jgi:hypothetical protein
LSRFLPETQEHDKQVRRGLCRGPRIFGPVSKSPKVSRLLSQIQNLISRSTRRYSYRNQPPSPTSSLSTRIPIMVRREACYVFLLAIELALVAVAVCVFAHGRISNLRTALWATGGDQGWNFNPRLRIYFYANHRKPPKSPFLWTEE